MAPAPSQTTWDWVTVRGRKDYCSWHLFIFDEAENGDSDVVFGNTDDFVDFSWKKLNVWAGKCLDFRPLNEANALTPTDGTANPSANVGLVGV